MTNSSILIGPYRVGPFVQTEAAPARKSPMDKSAPDFASFVKPVASTSEKVVEDKLAGLLFGTAVQLMLPKNSGANRFGEMWNSYLANAVADALGSSGKFDLRLKRD